MRHQAAFGFLRDLLNRAPSSPGRVRPPGRRKSAESYDAQDDSMGFCLSKCMPESDMATELEAELDESNRSFVQQQDTSAFGTTALLAVG